MRRDDWAEELLAHVARQALRDYRSGFQNEKFMDAAAWLRAAGLLDEDGRIDSHGHGRHLWKERLVTYPIHPESKLGKLQAAIAAGQAAIAAGEERLAPLAAEATEIDHWEQAAGLETDAEVGAAKHFRRTVILANEMARVRAEMTTQRYALNELEKKYRPVQDSYERVRDQLIAMQDPESDLVRLHPPYHIERQRRELEQWVREWIEPEASTEDALTLQEA